VKKLWIVGKQEYILQRMAQRGNSIKNPDEVLNKMLQALNENSPPDWRFSKRSPWFILRNVTNDITFVCFQRRKRESTDIVKDIQACIPKGGVAKEILAQNWDNPNRKGIANRPNVFIGTPDDHNIFETSSVIVRQHEKIHPEDKVFEYFKVFALCEDKMTNDYTYIKWNKSNGDLKFVERPPRDYHGEDFWKLEEC